MRVQPRIEVPGREHFFRKSRVHGFGVRESGYYSVGFLVVGLQGLLGFRAFPSHEAQVVEPLNPKCKSL